MPLVIELHDSEENSHAHTIGRRFGSIEYDYQAEMWVQETGLDPAYQDDRPGRWIVRWILRSEDGSERAVWERPSGTAKIPTLIRTSPAFQGTWKPGT